MIRYVSIAIAAAVALTACTSAQINRAEVKRDPERALVVGWGSTVGETLQNTVALPLGVRVGSLYVFKANGQTLENVENIAKFTPGMYDLTISCGLYIGGNFGSHYSTIRVDLKASRIYELRPRPQAVACAPYLDDVTDTYGQRSP